MQLIDSHCHLDDDRFDVERDELIAEAASRGDPADRAGHQRQSLGQDSATVRWSRRAVPGLRPAPDVYRTAPARIICASSTNGWRASGVVAVGECGIDFFISRVDEKWQKQLFREQLQLADNHRLPVIVHVRKAMDEVISLLRRQGRHGGVIHSFAGSEQQARQLYDLGFKLGIAATVGFERARKLRAVVAAMPEDALLLESDAPDQPGPGYRGQLNRPAYIVRHLKIMAELRQVPIEDLAATLTRNTESLFNL